MIVHCVRQADLTKMTPRFLGLAHATSCNWCNQWIQVTTSVGATTVGATTVDERDSVAEILLAADQRLYAAKCAGRERIIGPETLPASAATSPPGLPALLESRQP